MGRGARPRKGRCTPPPRLYSGGGLGVPGRAPAQLRRPPGSERARVPSLPAAAPAACAPGSAPAPAPACAAPPAAPAGGRWRSTRGGTVPHRSFPVPPHRARTPATSNACAAHPRARPRGSPAAWGELPAAPTRAAVPPARGARPPSPGACAAAPAPARPGRALPRPPTAPSSPPTWAGGGAGLGEPHRGLTQGI